MVSNISIELAGDFAHVETYLAAVHRVETDEGLRDDFLRCRYIDRFERRAGEWKIAKRTVVYDWGETRAAVDKGWWDTMPGDYTFGKHGREDTHYTERAATLALAR